MFRRGKKIAELQEPMGGWNQTGWQDLLIFGDWVIGAFGNGEMVVWKVASREVHTEILPGSSGGILGIVHPSTHLNKVVVARAGGQLEIWNIRTGYVRIREGLLCSLLAVELIGCRLEN